MVPSSSKTESDVPTDRRAQLAALAGLVLQVLLFAVLLGVSLAYDSPAVRAEAVYLLLGALVWLALAVLYTQRKRSGIEKLETEELKRSREAARDTGIFELEDEVLLVQRRRLKWVNRRLMPAFALGLALTHLIWSLRWYWNALPVRDPGWEVCSNPERALPFLVGATFLCFLYSRYASGMARRPPWRPLRAAASYMAGNAFLGLATIIALALQIYEAPYAEPVVTYVIRVGMLVLGVEFLMNFILDLYRPRVAEAEARPAFDSRLLGLISEPGGIARSIQEAINYQFGFEVSGTWFYQLLKRSLLPLALFAVLVLIGLSGLVIVDADEQAFIEHFGQVLQAKDAPLEPGLRFKYPWPVDAVKRRRVQQLRHLTVGEARKEKEDEDGDGEETETVLWTEKHDYLPELMLLVASPKNEGRAYGQESTALRSAPDDVDDDEGKAIPVSLIMASVDLEYRIKDLYQYEYNYVGPESVMENVAYQVLADHAAGIDVTSFMGPQRERISRELRALLQRRFDELNLGVELTFVGLQNAHPPSEENVAKTFQDVIAAKSRKEASIQAATGEAERILTRVAGSRRRALQLDEAIGEMDRLSEDAEADPAKRAAAKARVDELLLGSIPRGISPMSGEAAAEIAEARGEISKLVSEVESKARTFQNELIAYQAAPRLYRMRRYLDVLRSSLKNVRKIINTTQHTELVVIIETEKKSEFELPQVEQRP